MSALERGEGVEALGADRLDANKPKQHDERKDILNFPIFHFKAKPVKIEAKPNHVNSQDNFPALRKIFQKAKINIQPVLIGLENINYCRKPVLIGLENFPYCRVISSQIWLVGWTGKYYI